eukprot:6924643-Heterocapsa_arctica.AAC.1
MTSDPLAQARVLLTGPLNDSPSWCIHANRVDLIQFLLQLHDENLLQATLTATHRQVVYCCVAGSPA